MRVAMLTYSTRARGGVVHALKLAERLNKLGADATLYSLARSDDLKAQRGYFRKVDVPFEIFNYDWSPKMITRLERMIEAYEENLPMDADIYHAQDCVGGTALEMMRKEGRISAPIFRTVHHVDDFAEPTLFEFEKKAIRYPDFRFVVSKYWKDELRRTYGLDSIITYNGIDLGDYMRLPRRIGKRPTVLFVGGLEPRKGLEHLVKAMSVVIEAVPKARLVAVAKAGFTGREKWPRYLDLAKDLGIEDHMSFRESVSGKTLLRLYSEADVVVLPSRAEGWGLSLMEAMACRKPVVASNVGGIPELVRDGKDGLLVRPGDVKGLAKAIAIVLSDRDLARRMGAAGLSHVGNFSWDDTAKVVLKSYSRALQAE